jgi:FkbM family methyltransferase
MIIPRAIASFGRISPVDRLLRWYAAQYRENSVIKIRLGQAAGLFWRRHHRYVHSYWIGHYELAVQAALKREVKPGDTFFDIGANAGFFTLIAARLVGANGRCIAFEPARENCASIHEQIELNSLCPCQVVGEAISDIVGSTFFTSATRGSSSAHLGESEAGEHLMPVKVTTLDGACARFGRPDFIKMDIEGAEARALKGASHALRHLRPGFLIELHGPECERQVKTLLRDADYAFFALDGAPLQPHQTLPDHFVGRPRERNGA